MRREPLVRCIALLLPLVLLLGVWLGTPEPASAWSLPSLGGNAGRLSKSSNASVATPRSTRGPQEVAPPGAVQQIATALAQRQPRISILEPADGTLLPDGPWTLRLQVEDWPLVDAGSLGLGPHLMVQLDDGLPRAVVDTTVAMPPLSPGSHRVTVSAVRPWGEVVKAPGAFRQIRLHRVAANPLGLPAPGSPQLLAVSPSASSPGEPVLLDWLLIDAPLQNLRADDARWRLRVSLNGDSFLVSQQTPLWLKGWKPGSNAVLLELVDGRGDPLNPPFNSLVREVRLDPAIRRPAWLAPSLPAQDLASILGEAPPPAQEAAPITAPPAPVPTPAPSSELPASAPVVPVVPPRTTQSRTPEAPRTSEAQAIEAPPEAPLAAPRSETLNGEAQIPVAAPAPRAANPPSPLELEKGAPQPPPPPQEPLTSSEPPPSAVQPSPEAAALPPEAPKPPAEAPATAREPGSRQTLAPAENPVAALPPEPPASAEAQPAAPATSSLPSARDEVNPDGTLIRPRRPNPLQALRQRLGQ